MKTLKRNQSKIIYALYANKSEIVDDQGYRTGEQLNIYQPQTSMYAYVSAARGEADVDIFGSNLSYEKTLITDDLNCPIDEHSILWVDDLVSDAYDYVVVKKAKSLNSVNYAIKRVTVSSVPTYVQPDIPPTEPDVPDEPIEDGEDNVGEEP